MRGNIRITILVENSVARRGLRAEHGLAYHIRLGNRQVLFDTGQTDLIVQNARQLGIDLRQVDTVVLSHGHYDHTGGLAAVLELAPHARVVMHRAAKESKYSANADGSVRFVGMNGEVLAKLTEAHIDLCDDAPLEVAPGILATGQIPRTNEFEDVGGRFYRDAECTEPDPLPDDQALFIESDEGTVVLLGCAHAGVLNTVLHIESVTSSRGYACIVGGMHLLNASDERMQFTLDEFRHRDIRRLVPIHCSGIKAVVQLWAAFPDQCREGGVGTVFEFNR